MAVTWLILKEKRENHWNPWIEAKYHNNQFAYKQEYKLSYYYARSTYSQ